MKILITAPTQKELKYLQGILKSDKHDIVFFVSGVGLVATTFRLTQYLSMYKFDAVIQVGICGSYIKNLLPTSVVKVYAEHFLDNGKYSKRDGFKNIQELQLKTFQPQFDKKGKIENHSSLFHLIDLPSVNASTVGLILDSINSYRKKYIHTYNLEIETLEGFALHFVCDSLNIPYVQIRAVANRIEEQDKAAWEIDKSIQVYSKWIVNFFYEDLL